MSERSQLIVAWSIVAVCVGITALVLVAACQGGV